MKKRLVLVLLASVLALGLASAQADQAFKKGSWQFGGNLNASISPNYSPFDPSLLEYEMNDFTILADLSVQGSRFLADNFSLGLAALAYYREMTHENSDFTFNDSKYLYLGIGLEPSFHLPLGRRLALSLGLEASFLVNPGLAGLYSDVVEPDKSLTLALGLEPKLGATLFVSDSLALTATLGARVLCGFDVLDEAGLALGPSLGDSLRDTIANGKFTLGLSYFIPNRGILEPKVKKASEMLGTTGGKKAI